MVADADTALAAMAAEQVLGIQDLADGRTENDKTIALIVLANTAMGKMDATVNLALNSLMASQSFVNAVNVGDNPDARLMALGNRFLDIVSGYQAESQAYMQQAAADETVSREYTSLAMGEFAAVNSKLNTARGYLQEANVTEGSAAAFVQMAIAEIRAAAEYRQQGMAYLQEAQADALAARTYSGISAAGLTAARADLNQGIAYIRELMARLSTARTILQYKASARMDLENIHEELMRFRKPNQKIEYGVS